MNSQSYPVPDLPLALPIMEMLGSIMANRFADLTEQEPLTLTYAAGYIALQLMDAALSDPDWGKRLLDQSLGDSSRKANAAIYIQAINLFLEARAVTP